ncbi:MAG: hypothetical protein JNK99_14560, partial [Candidatus Accumulibacter sp.]|uniref:hypothetical protein n=1 Tax=Accumulibacter sp. TaxID=2053492 RepID=UPI001A437A9C
MNPTIPHPPLAPATRRASAPQAVNALHDLAEAIAVLHDEMTDPIDRAALLNAQQLLEDLAYVHGGLCWVPEHAPPGPGGGPRGG